VASPQDANDDIPDAADALTREIPAIDVVDGELVPRRPGEAPTAPGR
jgi:hypothetical protein